MQKPRTLWLLGCELTIVLALSSLGWGQAEGAERPRISIDGASYTVVDRLTYSELRFGRSELDGRRGQARAIGCSEIDSEAPAAESLSTLMHIPDSKRSGFSATVLRARLSREQDFGTGLLRGSMEIALFNPCRSRVLVPVEEMDELAERDDTVDYNQLLLVLSTDSVHQGTLNMAFVVVTAADTPESYRILEPNEAVVLVLPFLVSSETGVTPLNFEDVFEDVNLWGMYSDATHFANGMSTRGHGYLVPCVQGPVPVDIGTDISETDRPYFHGAEGLELSLTAPK